MSDDAQAPQAPRDATGTPWASPDHGSTPSQPADAVPTVDPEDAIPGAGPAPARPTEPAVPGYDATDPRSGTAAPADRPPGNTADRLPGDAADRVPGTAAPVAPALPAASLEKPNPWAPPADPAPARFDGGPARPAAPLSPASPPAAGSPSVHDQPTMAAFPGTGGAAGPAGPSWDNPFAPPAGHTPYPATAGEPVPPPPIAPDGPGQAPYGYGYGHPAAYGQTGAGQPGAPGHPGTPGFPGYPVAGGYPGAGYGWPAPVPQPSNGMGTAGLVVGIISAVVFCLWPIAFVLGVLGVIFGAVGRRRARRGEATNPGQALAGIICGAVGIALSIAMVVLFFFVPDDDSGDSPFTGDDGYSTSFVIPG
ncbi:MULTISPECIES: DUF4190 domain-containing protein [unclassified Streptomyces]|uniref:DUF4190 domain-containing protein n=1 Tax=unclassified Streptomyces TaxID=2593676 RepID=UPI002E35EC6B|nr:MULTISPECIES: DUF4190 domain-containing protein [unclassified Streptomyces]